MRRWRVIFCKSPAIGLKHVSSICGEIGVLLQEALRGLGLRQGEFVIVCGRYAIWRGFVALDGEIGVYG